MLIPKEKPYIDGLNSYYLQVDYFIEHLQGEIGSGCLYCKSVAQELLVYFEERDIVRTVTQVSGEQAQVFRTIRPVLESLKQRSFDVTVYYLAPDSIFFWGQIPPFKRAKSQLTSSDIPLPELIFKLRQKEFSGFVDITLPDKGDAGLLFFHDGERRGGSYSWGNGGLSTTDDDYNRLLGLLQTNIGIYNVGHFQAEYQIQDISDATELMKPETTDAVDFDLAIKEFMTIFLQTIRKKTKKNPLLLLKQEFLEQVDRFPVVDPFRNLYQIKDDGTVLFAAGSPKKEIISALIICSWHVANACKLHSPFSDAIASWPYKAAFEKQGIRVNSF